MQIRASIPSWSANERKSHISCPRGRASASDALQAGSTNARIRSGEAIATPSMRWKPSSSTWFLPKCGFHVGRQIGPGVERFAPAPYFEKQVGTCVEKLTRLRRGKPALPMVGSYRRPFLMFSSAQVT